MKIVENYDVDGVHIEEIPYGDMFVFSGSYHMRVKKDNSIIDLKIIEEVSIDLATGELSLVPPGEMVPPIFARIRISGRAD